MREPWGVFSASSPVLDGALAEASGENEGGCSATAVRDRYDMADPVDVVPVRASATAAPDECPAVRTTAIGDETIRLGQLLKLAGLIEAGGDARAILTEQRVRVNGEVEVRRGRQVRSGDVVSLDWR